MINELSTTRPKFKLGLIGKNVAPTDDVENTIEEMNNANNLPLEFVSFSKLNEHINQLIQNHLFLLFFELLKKISVDFEDRGITFDELKNKYVSYFQNNIGYSKLFFDLFSANLETMDLNQLKQEIINSKINEEKQISHQKTPNLKYNMDQSNLDQSNNTKKMPSIDNETVAPSCDSVPTEIDDDDDDDDAQIDHTKCSARTANGKQCSRKKQKNQGFCGSHIHNQPHGRIDQAIDPNKNKPKKRGRPPKNFQKQQKLQPQQVNVVQMDVDIETISGIDYIVDNDGNIYKIPDGFNQEEDVIDADKLKLLGKKMSGDLITWYSDTDLKFI